MFNPYRHFCLPFILHEIALNILNSGRIKLAAGTTGGSKFAITKAVKYAIEREQFGVSISTFGAMKFKIAEMTTNTFTCDSAVYRTGKNIDTKTEEFKAQGLEAGEAKLKALREFAIECAILKVKGSDNTDYCVDDTSSNFFKLYPTDADRIANTNIIDITATGSGSFTVYAPDRIADLNRPAFFAELIEPGSGGGNILTPRIYPITPNYSHIFDDRDQPSS